MTDESASDTEERLLYERHWRVGPGQQSVDASPVIAFFKVDQPFIVRGSEGVREYRITRIDREGIWGVLK